MRTESINAAITARLKCIGAIAVAGCSKASPAWRNLRYSLLVVLFVVALDQTLAADAAPLRETKGGLTCFSIEIPAYGTQNCESLCQAQGANCTGVTSAINPPLSCEAESTLATCRCCTVQK